MKILRNLFVAPVVAGLLFAAIGAVAPSMARAADAPTVGSMAPNFTLNSQEGTPVSLNEFRGKWVVLYFYPKDFTKGCTIEAHGFEADMPKYHAMNAVVVGVSVDSVDSHKDFCAKEGLEFKLLSDADKKIVQLYGSARDMNGTTVAQRNTFIINPQGKVVKVFLSVDPNKHSAEVLAALAEAQRGSM
jgi:thioredoxin-dependent peroxiredoxin